MTPMYGHVQLLLRIARSANADKQARIIDGLQRLDQLPSATSAPRRCAVMLRSAEAASCAAIKNHGYSDADDAVRQHHANGRASARA
jgi:hypothetical protein